MWYVIWTSTGSERRAKELIENRCKRCFYPTRKINKKVRDEWKTEIKPLLPGYIFADTDDVEALAAFLWNSENFNKILDTDRKYYDLYGDDKDMIEKLYQDGGMFDTSKGYIEGDRIIVTAGPLVGMEASITKIDRHKRIAYITLDLFNQKLNTSVGLEIIQKQ